jgi:hypothetical protein
VTDPAPDGVSPSCHVTHPAGAVNNLLSGHDAGPLRPTILLVSCGTQDREYLHASRVSDTWASHEIGGCDPDRDCGG